MNKKWLQKSACILLTVSMMQICTSCNETEDASSSGIKTNGGFKIYRLESDHIIKGAIWKFRVIYPNIVIEENTIADPTEYSNIMNTELMAGEGPDVIVADPSIFNSFHKTMNSGIFYDINSFMENDNDFIPSEYNKTVLDSGIVDGKRLFVPIAYKVPCIWTTKSISEDTGLSSLMDTWTWQQLLDIGKTFTESIQNGQKRYLFSYQYDNILNNLHFPLGGEGHDEYGGKQSYYGAFYGLLLSSGTEFVDYEKKQSHFNSSPFISLLETLKELNNYSTPDKVLESYKTAYYTQLKEKSLLAVCDGKREVLSSEGLLNNSSFIDYILEEKEKLALYPFPTFSKDKKVIAEPIAIAAVNSNSKDKETAYYFIRILLSLNRQRTIGTGIPVNNTALDPAGLSDSASAELVEEAKKITNNISGCEVMDQSILTFVLESVDSFIKGDITAKQAAEMIDNKVMLFLSE